MSSISRSGLVVLMLAGLLVVGCAKDRELPQAMMPSPPKECEQVLGFKVEPLPSGKSNAAALSVAMAKEGATRQQEHTISKVCAEYALRVSNTMKDKEAPSEARRGVDAATKVPPTRPARKTAASRAATDPDS